MHVSITQSGSTICSAPSSPISFSASRHSVFTFFAPFGDPYVLSEHRLKGLARRLVEHAKAWCRTQGCSAVSVTITPAGERRHGLSQFYARLGFAQSGRMCASATLDADC